MTTPSRLCDVATMTPVAASGRRRDGDFDASSAASSSSASASLRASSRALEDVRAWSRSVGVRVAPGVDVRCVDVVRGGDRGSHRGVFATQDIDAGSMVELITIPERAMIAARRAADADGCGGSQDDAYAQDELALELLRHKARGVRGEFHAYIESMPKSYNLLHSWSEEEMAALQDARATALARERKQDMERAYERVKTTVREILGDSVASEHDARAAYVWARDTVSSRAVSVPFHRAGALTPMGDMFNYAPHDPPVLLDVHGAPMFDAREDTTETERSRNGDDDAPIPGDGAYVDGVGFTFRSAAQPHGRRGVRAGEEIFVCYGEYINLELLELYGFTLAPDENPQDAYVLDVRVSDADSAPLKVFVGGFAWNDLADVRIAIALKRPRKNEKYLRDIARRGGALGAEEELETFEAIRDAAATALLSFPTTAKADLDTVESDAFVTMSENMQLAMTWRLGIKRIIQRAYKWADARASDARTATVSAGVANISLPYVAKGRR
jgi:hypothetical protein